LLVSAAVLNTSNGKRTTHFILAVGNKYSSGSGYTLSRGDLKLDASAPYLFRKWTQDAERTCTETAAAVACAPTWLAGSAGPHLALMTQNQSDASTWDNASQPFAHELWGVYPVLGDGFVLLGELGKFVGVSETRFGAVTVDGSKMVVEVRGDPGEVVTVTAAVPKGAPLLSRFEQTAGNCSGFENDTDFGGNDLVNYDGFVSAAACCANCTGTAGCVAWTWAGPKPAAGPPDYCWLKTSAANKGKLVGHAGIV
jgi:hypothetical protein